MNSDIHLSPSFQISLSTADEESYYFTGEQVASVSPEFEKLFPSGLYRVLDDKLYMIVEGLPPELSSGA